MLTSKESWSCAPRPTAWTPPLMVGKGGVTEQVVLEAVTQLEARELVKGRVLEAALLCGQGGAGGAVRRHRRGARVYCGLQIRPVPGV